VAERQTLQGYFSKTKNNTRFFLHVYHY
jgi:hypothetical protein